MNINDVIHGFRVTNRREISEIAAVLYEMEHEKSGASLCWLERDDNNKTFLIAFKTLPDDDTGVFHILEHSVLCGSRKYPVKEPFVELLKGSLQTFLNAFTYPDKTVYPVCSRNDKDFMNLINVYMDAVLHPAIYDRPEIFLQEGWHYEMNDAANMPSYKGVVFNEMKGAMSSVDDCLSMNLQSEMYPDNCYKYNSGGDPEHIPSLSYESFTEHHQKFYHPSNSRIFLDGRMDIDAVLCTLDTEYLCDYDRIAPAEEIKMQQPVAYHEVILPYEIGKDEDSTDKSMVGIGYLCCDYTDKEKLVALQVLRSAISSGNESPLKKRILESGLGTDINLDIDDGILQPMAEIVVRDCSTDNIPQIKSAVREVFEQLANDGIDREMLEASISRMEFKYIERDSGSMPRGLLNGLSMLDSWLYGGDPALYLTCLDVFSSIRKKAEEGYFEQLIREVFLENPHSVLVGMEPSRVCGDERIARENQRLKDARDSWNGDDIRSVLQMNRELNLWHESKDSEDALETIPTCSLSDIPEKSDYITASESSVNGVKIYTYAAELGEIIYGNLYFPLTNYRMEQLCDAQMLTELICNVDTASYDVLTLHKKIRLMFGGLGFDVAVYNPQGDISSAYPVVTVRFSVLREKYAQAMELLTEILLNSDFSSAQKANKIVRQNRSDIMQDIISSGHSFAMSRISSYTTAGGVARDYTSGCEYSLYLKREAQSDSVDMCRRISAMYHEIFSRQGASMSITDNADSNVTATFTAALPTGAAKPAYARYAPIGVRQEGIEIPAAICFAGAGANLMQIGYDFCGEMKVLAQIVNYNWLWNEVRVKGGAYGVGLGISELGGCMYYSYRDPDAANALSAFSGSGDYIRDFCMSGAQLDQYIIGTVAESDPLMLQKARIARADADRFAGITAEQREKYRSEMLHCTPAKLTRLANMLDSVTSKGAVCVVGGRDKLQSLELPSILTI